MYPRFECDVDLEIDPRLDCNVNVKVDLDVVIDPRLDYDADVEVDLDLHLTSTSSTNFELVLDLVTF